jgi:Protein of unknown function (DUF3176)
LLKGLGQTKWLWFLNPRSLYHYPIYDNASQGPSNAFELLWTLRGKYKSLVKHCLFSALNTGFY